MMDCAPIVKTEEKATSITQAAGAENDMAAKENIFDKYTLRQEDVLLGTCHQVLLALPLREGLEDLPRM